MTSHHPRAPRCASLLALSLLVANGGSHADPGHWQTDFGPLFLEQKGAAVRGIYPDYRGEIRGELDADARWLHGVWLQPSSERRCAVLRDGARYWGTVSLRGLTGDRFEGMWAYCDEPPGSGGAWNGTRVGGDALVSPSEASSADRALADPPRRVGAVTLDEARGLMRVEFGRRFPFASAAFLAVDMSCDGHDEVAVAWTEGSDPDALGAARLAVVYRDGDLLAYELHEVEAAASAGCAAAPTLTPEPGATLPGCVNALGVRRGGGCAAQVFRWDAGASPGQRLLGLP